MKKIKLTHNKFTLVDNSDFELLNRYKWYPIKSGKNIYVARVSSRKEGKSKTIMLHRYIMNTPDGMDTDHIDGNSLNNQRKNLRVCTRSQNKMNVGKRRDNESGYKGVSWSKTRKKWVSHIWVNGKGYNLGGFDSKLKAYEAYCNACISYHGEFRHY